MRLGRAPNQDGLGGVRLWTLDGKPVWICNPVRVTRLRPSDEREPRLRPSAGPPW